MGIVCVWIYKRSEMTDNEINGISINNLFQSDLDAFNKHDKVWPQFQFYSMIPSRKYFDLYTY